MLFYYFKEFLLFKDVLIKRIGIVFLLKQIYLIIVVGDHKRIINYQ